MRKRGGASTSILQITTTCGFSSIAKNGVVLAVEKKQKTVLYDESSINKVSVCLSVFLSVFLATN